MKKTCIVGLLLLPFVTFGQPPLVKKIEDEFKKTTSYYLYESVIRSMYNLIDQEVASRLPGEIEMIVSVEIKGDSVKKDFKTIQGFIAEENMEVFMDMSNLNLGKDFLGIEGMTISDGKIKRLKVFVDEGDTQVSRIILLMRSLGSVNFISFKGSIDLEAMPGFINMINTPSKLFNSEQ